MTVPFVDLRAIHAPIEHAILADIAAVVESGAFINGPEVAHFEQEFAAYCTAEHAVGVASGLDALRLALLAADVGTGDEVIAPANTFVATIEAISQTGATPVLVDVGENDLNVDVEAAQAAMTDRTRALLPVHLYGQLADMRALTALAAERELVLVEDAAQAHGAVRDGLRAGAGPAAGFSFYPGKNLGAFGDAGAATTDNVALAERIRALREHGQRRKYEHDLVGYTARLDTIQAVVLRHKLRALEDWNGQRRAIAAAYQERLTGLGDLRLPPVAVDSDPVWHLYVVRTADPGALAHTLAQRDIATGRHYPQPVHLTAAYAHLGHRRGEFPVTEELAARGLSLPIYPGMTEAHVEEVFAGVSAHFAGPARSTG